MEAQMNKQEEALINVMLQIRNGTHPSRKLTKELRERLLALGSSTPDNLNCARHIEVGAVRSSIGHSLTRCVKVRKKPISIANVINALEDARVPKVVRDSFPDLTRDEWRACLRVVTLFLLLFEHKDRPRQQRVGRET